MITATGIELREQIVTEARSWIGTPYRTRGRVKGAGCDCGSFLLSVAVNCGLIEDEHLKAYSVDCWAHWSDERYFAMLMRHTVKLMQKVAYRNDTIQPGSFLLTRSATSTKFNHGGIVTRWPFVIHCLTPEVQESDATKHFLWAYKEIAIFDSLKVIE